VEKQQILILIFDLTKPGTNPRNTTLEASMQVDAIILIKNSKLMEG
jgi:hypothetical protein